MMGMPSAISVNATALLTSAASEVRENKRGTSWFSGNEPSMMLSLHVFLTVAIVLARSGNDPGRD